MSSYPREGLESHASQGRIKGMKLPHVVLIRSSPWDQMEGRFLGSRVWGESERGELGHEPSWARGGEGVVGRKRGE